MTPTSAICPHFEETHEVYNNAYSEIVIGEEDFYTIKFECCEDKGGGEGYGMFRL